LASIIGEKVENIVELAASAPPGANGLLFLPYLLGRGTPYNDDRASGTLHGLTISSNRQDISRAVLEGITLALNNVLQALPNGSQPRNIHITGGGARSPVWTQIIADMFDESVAVYSSQPALGAAILAAVGVGIYPTVEKAARAMAHPNRLQQPNAENHTIYQHIKQRFQTLL
jgi:xylulokinase